jgi:hypothetical protein
MSVVVTPSARERFTPEELTAAYEDFTKHGPQYLDAETGLRAAAGKPRAGASERVPLLGLQRTYKLAFIRIPAFSCLFTKCLEDEFPELQIQHPA